MFNRLLSSITAVVAVALLAFPVPSLPAADLLTLAEAEQLALSADKRAARFESLAEGAKQRAISDAQLPDPRLRLGAVNLPVDSFALDEQAMTQILVGARQSFPRGETRTLRAQRSQSEVASQGAQGADARLKTLRSLRSTWVELLYWIRAEQSVTENRKLFEELVNVTHDQYASGRLNQHDVLRSELELGLLDDRLANIRTQQQKFRAELARWIGAADAARRLEPGFPALPRVAEVAALRTGLNRHPRLRAADARIESSRLGVALAKQAYKPAWSLDVSYGFREDGTSGVERPDFLSAMVMLDLPLFTANRQDRRVADRQQMYAGSVLSRDDRLSELSAMLDEAYAAWELLGERTTRYSEYLLQQARDSSAAALQAYQNNAATFADVVRASITELNTELQAARLQADRAKAQAMLLYLVGDVQ